MVNKKSQASPKLVEIKLNIEINWAKSSKILLSNLGLIGDNKYKKV